MKHYCEFPEGIVVKPDGIHELEFPCRFREAEKYANVTVTISYCKNCGRQLIEWTRQSDTVELPIEV